MKRVLLCALLMCGAMGAGAQSTTPNIGLQIPATGSNNWYVPLNYNFTVLDRYLSGNLPVPNFAVTGNLTVGGTITAGGYAGAGGSSFVLSTGAAQYAAPYFSGPGASSTISGASLTGLPWFTTYAAPRAALFGDIVGLWTGSGCSTPTNLLQVNGSCSAGGGGGGNATSIQGVAVATTAPVEDAVLVYTASSTDYAVRQLTQDDILPGFAIDSFSGGGGVVEIGATITNPSFTASYSATPASAAITNTAGIDSPLDLSSPFTNGTVTGAFTKTTASAVTFTLTAVGTTTKTATQADNWEPRVFAGVGAAGATSTVTASGETAVLSTGDVLANEGLSNSQVGATYTLAPANQYVYLLLIGGSHTFTSAGFSFPMNAPVTVSFVNTNGATVTMYLYQSTNELDTPSIPVTVAS